MQRMWKEDKKLEISPEMIPLAKVVINFHLTEDGFNLIKTKEKNPQ